MVDLLLQIAGTHALDHVGAQAQPCALHVQIGLAVHHYAIALLVVARHLGEGTEAEHAHRDVLVVVAQREIGRS